MLSAIERRGGPIIGGGVDRNATTSASTFQCHPNGESQGTFLIGLATAGVIANATLAGLILARKSLRRWSSGLSLHGTLVDGCRALLLFPLGKSVLLCQPVTRCSIIDTAFLLLATVTSLNLLSTSLNDAPFLPPPVLVPKLLQSAGYGARNKPDGSNNIFGHSSLYSMKGDPPSYYTQNFFEEDANLLADTTAAPDSPQCVLFGAFMVWFAALTINLGPTFLSGALAAQAEVIPSIPSCPLVRGPTRHIVLNALWAAVNLLCVLLATLHLRKLKKDLGRARLGMLAAAGAGLAGLTGITAEGRRQSAIDGRASSNNDIRTPSEVDKFLRHAQKTGRCHIRTLGTLAIVNLVCWLPLYICALAAPISRESPDDPAPIVYELTLVAAFSHSILHPVFLLALHEPLREAARQCLFEWCCCFCIWLGIMESNVNSVGCYEDVENLNPNASIIRVHTEQEVLPARSRSHSPHQLQQQHIQHASSHHSLHNNEREEELIGNDEIIDDLIPPPPPPAVNCLKKQQQKSFEIDEESDEPLGGAQVSRSLENRCPSNKKNHSKCNKANIKYQQ